MNTETPTRVCFICNKPDPAQTAVRGWNVDGVLFSAVPGYGSRFDASLLCEERLQIFVHDECLAERHHAVLIVHQARAIKPESTIRPWHPSYNCSAPIEPKDPNDD